MLKFDTAYMRAKCDHACFSRSGDMVGAHQNLNSSRELTIRGLAIPAINLSTKFEVCISTHYVDMKGDTKYRK